MVIGIAPVDPVHVRVVVAARAVMVVIDHVVAISYGVKDSRNHAVIVAGASNLDDTRWTSEIEAMGRTFKQGSDFGKRLTVMAPTENIRVCMPHAARFYSCDDGPVGQEKEEFKGPYDILPNGATSSAAPIVSSLAALVLSIRPDLDAEEVIRIIKRGCDDIGEKGYDILGVGLPAQLSEGGSDCR